MDRAKDESGSVTVAAVAMALVLALLLAGTLDLGAALAKRTSMADDLAYSLDELKTPASALVVKNSPSPDREIAERVVGALRANGTDGEVDVWVAEQSAGAAVAGYPAVPQDKRAIAVYVTVRGGYEPFTVGAFTGEIDVGCADACSIIPYSANAAWAPVRIDDQAYHYRSPEGADSAQGEAVRFARAPQALKDQLSAAVAEARGE